MIQKIMLFYFVIIFLLLPDNKNAVLLGQDGISLSEGIRLTFRLHFTCWFIPLQAVIAGHYILLCALEIRIDFKGLLE